MNVPTDVILFVDELVQINREEVEYNLRMDMEEKLEAQKEELTKEMEERMKLLVGEKPKNDVPVSPIESYVDAPKHQRSDNFFQSVKRIFGLKSYSSLTNINTETLTMFAVADIVTKDGKAVRKTVISLLSLTVILTQFFILDLILLEASWPECVSMADCPSGTYCAVERFRHPTCNDCSQFQNFDKNYPNGTDDFCTTLFPEGKWKQYDLIDIDHNELLILPSMSKSRSETESNRFKCLAYKHCKENDLDSDNNFLGRCDFLRLNTSRIETRSWVLLSFLGLLWAIPLSKDIEEACWEEIVLDHYLDGSLKIYVEILRLSLRIRSSALPFMSTSATLMLLVTDVFSAKNAILNFLAVTFITEADNVLATFFLRSHHNEEMIKVVEDLKTTNFHTPTSISFWARMQGLSCFAMLIVGLINIRVVNTVTNCRDLATWLFDSAAVSFLILIAMKAVYHAFLKRVETSKHIRIFRALNEASRNLIGFLLAHGTTIAFSLLAGDRSAFSLTWNFYLFPIGFGVFFVLEFFRWII